MDDNIKNQDSKSQKSQDESEVTQAPTKVEKAPTEVVAETLIEDVAKSEAVETTNEGEVKSEPEKEAKSETVKATSEVESAPEEKNETLDDGDLKLDEEAGSSKVEEIKEDQTSNPEPQDPASSIQPPTSKPDVPGARWYVVHTYSGHENKVAATLKQRIESENLEKKILEVLVPMQDKIEIKGGKKITIKEKIFPGYILVKMVLDDTSWLAVRTTQGVTSFVGMGNKPTPISDSEVATIVRFTQTEAPVYK